MPHFGPGVHRSPGRRRFLARVDARLRSTDPPPLENYRSASKRRSRKRAPREPCAPATARLDGNAARRRGDGLQLHGRLDGVGRGREDRPADRRSVERHVPLVNRVGVGRGEDAGGGAVPEQMAKSSVEIARLRAARVPFSRSSRTPPRGGVRLIRHAGGRDPAGPGAVVGFAGPRLIKQTIGQDLPPASDGEFC